LWEQKNCSFYNNLTGDLLDLCEAMSWAESVWYSLWELTGGWYEEHTCGIGKEWAEALFPFQAQEHRVYDELTQLVWVGGYGTWVLTIHSKYYYFILIILIHYYIFNQLVWMGLDLIS
jgi:hypothetical protein